MNDEHKIEYYADPDIASYHKKVPTFLILTYIILPIWGIATCIIYFNGSSGWFDRGHWHQLQVVANTTMPFHDSNFPEFNHHSGTTDKAESLQE